MLRCRQSQHCAEGPSLVPCSAYNAVEVYMTVDWNPGIMLRKMKGSVLA